MTTSIWRRLSPTRSSAAVSRCSTRAHPAELGEEAPALALVLLVGLAVVVAVAHEIAQPHLPGAQALGEPEHVAQRRRQREHALDQLAFVALDALGDLDLALAREQRRRAHLPQVD